MEALRQEAREEAADQAVLEVDLHDLGRVAAVGQARRLEGDGADGYPLAPLVDPLAASARAGAQIVEGVLPAGLFCESWIGGIEGKDRDVADGPGAGALERGAGAHQRRADDAPEVVRGNAHAGTRGFERLLQLLLVLQDALVTGSFLVVHLVARACEPLGVGLLLDRLCERLGLATVDARCLHPVLDALLDDLAGGAKLLLDHLGLTHQSVEHDVGLALLVSEIAAEYLFRGLKLAIDAAIALLEPRRIPGQIEMQEFEAPSL